MHVRRLRIGALSALILITTFGTATAADPPELLGANRARTVAGSSDASAPAARLTTDEPVRAADPPIEAPAESESAEASDAEAAARRAAARADDARPLGGTPMDAFAAPTATDETDASASWLDENVVEVARVVGALAVVLGLIVALRFVLTRMAGPLAAGTRPSGVLEILARYPMGKQQSIVLMRLGRRVLVVHHAGQTMTTLTEVNDADEVADLLARMESGSRLKDAVRFRKTLEKCQSEHHVADGNTAASWPASRDGEAVVIDLTRPQRKRSA